MVTDETFNRIFLLWLYILSIFFYAKRLQNRCKFVSVCAAGLSEDLCTRRCRPLSSVLSLTALSALRCSPATQACPSRNRSFGAALFARDAACSVFVVSLFSSNPLAAQRCSFASQAWSVNGHASPQTWRHALRVGEANCLIDGGYHVSFHSAHTGRRGSGSRSRANAHDSANGRVDSHR